MMNAMMEETLLTGTAHKAELPGWQAAGKTGTSQEWRDAWFVGYTSYLVAGVWLGNDDGTPTKKVSGGNLPVEIWSRFMKAAHQGVPPAGLPLGDLAQPRRAAARAAGARVPRRPGRRLDPGRPAAQYQPRKRRRGRSRASAPPPVRAAPTRPHPARLDPERRRRGCARRARGPRQGPAEQAVRDDVGPRRGSAAEMPTDARGPRESPSCKIHGRC